MLAGQCHPALKGTAPLLAGQPHPILKGATPPRRCWGGVGVGTVTPLLKGQSPSEGGEVAARLGALSSQRHQAGEEAFGPAGEAATSARTGTVAVFLPSSSFLLLALPPPAPVEPSLPYGGSEKLLGAVAEGGRRLHVFAAAQHGRQPPRLCKGRTEETTGGLGRIWGFLGFFWFFFHLSIYPYICKQLPAPL